MSVGDGHPIEHVQLKLTLRAKGLLTEECPVTETEVYQVKRTWFWEGDINALEGIGRFVLGLPREAIYMNERNLKRAGNFARVREDIQGLYNIILR